MTLAINGGKPAVTTPLRKYNTIGEAEIAAAVDAMRSGPLSGYLGGIDKGGRYVEELEETFAGMLGVKHAVACNSATSGLLMACTACNVQQAF
jgi:dTDP-4-amino-4,6-dideoxygalactose transaminase